MKLNEEAFKFLEKFFSDRGYTLVDVRVYEEKGHPVNVTISKNGIMQFLKIPIETFESSHLESSLDFVLDSLRKSGVLK